MDGWGSAGAVGDRPGHRRLLRAAAGVGGDDRDGSGPVDGAPWWAVPEEDHEDGAGLDRPAYVRTEDERRALARRVLAAGSSPGTLVVVQNTVVRDRGRPPGRNGLRVVAGGSHDRHPGLYLGYVADGRCGFVDRELHLPRSVFRSLALRTVAGLPDGLEYAGPSQLVMRMLTRSLEAGARADWLVVGPGLAQHWPLRTLTALRGLGLLAELTAEETEAELAGGRPEAVEGGVVDGHVWAIARRASSRRDGTWLVLRHRLADPADRTTMICHSPGPVDLTTVLRLMQARQQAAAAFAQVRRHARTGPVAAPGAGQPSPTGPTGPAVPPDPWTAWYERVTRAMVAQADDAFPPAERSG